jgi:hypothetical protein
MCPALCPHAFHVSHASCLMLLMPHVSCLMLLLSLSWLMLPCFIPHGYALCSSCLMLIPCSHALMLLFHVPIPHVHVHKVLCSTSCLMLSLCLHAPIKTHVHAHVFMSMPHSSCFMLIPCLVIMLKFMNQPYVSASYVDHVSCSYSL